jgi:tRNA threonylcarbamoyladenosine biosynthesis protein TsaE
VADENIINVTSEHPDQTRNLGRKVGRLIKKPLNLALIGQLGSGKTLFVKGLAQGLGVSAKEPITSPTYTIINAYGGLFHIDLYRLNGIDDIEAAGVLELLDGPYVCAVEWADQLLEEDLGSHLKFEFSVIKKDLRNIEITAHGEDAMVILNGLVII